MRAGCRCGPRAHPRVGGDGPRSAHTRPRQGGSPPRGRGRPAVAGGHADGLGSPPRGRGRRRFSLSAIVARGLTPAWAGTAPRPALSMVRTGLTPAWAGTALAGGHPSRDARAHPRVGGDGDFPSGRSAGRPARAHPRVGWDGDADGIDEPPMLGSPPRGRGRLALVRLPGIERGLTPAWAGTAIPWCNVASACGAHPRMGGDGTGRPTGTKAGVGSPPHGRGRRRTPHGHQGRSGLTPAWAGTARRPGRAARRRRAHPRVGGDGNPRQVAMCWATGSPPRGRGRPRHRRQAGAAAGLTPAWAGTAGNRGVPTGPPGGSPPRGRGRRAVERGDLPEGGLTPAWAGTSGRWPAPSSTARAHPRVGGDGVLTPFAGIGSEGSPPRGRGRPQGVDGGRADAGLTPAWAGTAARRSGGTSSPRAHPRVGGDGAPSSRCGSAPRGSPPRGRGRRGAGTLGGRPAGLTPAWAGTASRWTGSSGRRWAHPRVGGDGGTSAPPDRDRRGSPPRGRGRRHLDGATQFVRGLTPAWAGTAAGRRPLGSAARAHPRVGGDGTVSDAAGSSPVGSPPRGRGRLHAQEPRGGCRGLTPAWAGTACVGHGGIATVRAHPRVGGDGSLGESAADPAQGSPPRGRGRPCRARSGRTAAGLTPAWAGTATRQVVQSALMRAHPRVGGDGVVAPAGRWRQ